MQRDNGAGAVKVQLRKAMLRELRKQNIEPIVLEAYGGSGWIGDRCYQDVDAGVVFEKSGTKAVLLARKRPTWAVYQADCIKALSLGAGAHVTVTLLDIDPYGDSGPALTAYFGSARPRAETLVVAIHDCGIVGVRMGADTRATLEDRARRGSAATIARYHQSLRENIHRNAALAGYSVTGETLYTSGNRQSHIHYGALLRRVSDTQVLVGEQSGARPGAEHRKYLRSTAWRRTRARKLDAAGHRCEDCSATEKLTVHHLTYDRLYAELMDDLRVLCASCHTAQHEAERGPTPAGGL